MCSQTRSSLFLAGIVMTILVAGGCTPLTSIDNGIAGPLPRRHGGQRRNPRGVRGGARRQTESPLLIEDARPRRIRAPAIRRNLPGRYPSDENTTDITQLAVAVLSEPEIDAPIHVMEGILAADPESAAAFTTRLLGLRSDIVTHPS